MQPERLLKMGLGTARYRLTGHRVPLHVMLTVTHKCNALCSTCGVPLKTVRELDTEEWAALIDHLAKIGTSRASIGGGEPLTRPDIDAIIDRCAAHQIWTSLETNGHLVPDRISALKNLKQLVISLDGRPSTHDVLRERGSHAKVIEAIRVARKAGLPVWTMTVLNRRNLGEIEYLLELAEEEGFIANFQVLQTDSGPYGKTGSRLRPSQSETQQALRVLLEAKLLKRPVGQSEKTLRYLLTWEDYQRATSVPAHEDLHCLAGQLYCAIDADGTVYPCTLSTGSFPGRNIRDVGFEAAFEALRDNPCRACTSTALTEYNFLYNLNLPALFEWTRSGRWHQETKAT